MKKLLFLIFLFTAISFTAFAQKNVCIKIEGEIQSSQTLCASDLEGMNRVKARMKEHDGKEFEFEGVLVSDILKKAGVPLGKELKGNNLRKYLLIKAADGYQVVFSLAELDSSFTDRIVLLADRMEGKPLPANKGPFRVIIPGEKKHARCIYQVTELKILVAKE